jgi:hypothetical protein
MKGSLSIQRDIFPEMQYQSKLSDARTFAPLQTVGITIDKIDAGNVIYQMHHIGLPVRRVALPERRIVSLP